MRSKRVLITGITGFTGRYLYEALLQKGCEVQGVSLSAESDFIRADLTDISSVRRCFADYQPTHIVHLAGQSFPGHADASEIYAHNVTTSVNLMSALPKARDLRQLIIVSSAAVYGNMSDPNHISEDAPTVPLSHYGVSKVCVEMISRIYGRDYPITIVRPFNYIGIGQRSQFFVPKIIQAFVEKQDLLRIGNTDVVRDFSDVRDVVDIYMRLLESDITGQTLNICSGHGVELREIISYISTLTNHKAELVVDPELVRSNEPKIMIGSKGRLESVIGPVIPRDIHETLKWIVEGHGHQDRLVTARSARR